MVEKNQIGCRKLPADQESLNQLHISSPHILFHKATIPISITEHQTHNWKNITVNDIETYDINMRYKDHL